MRQIPCIWCGGRGYADVMSTLTELGLRVGQRVSVHDGAMGRNWSGTVAGEPKIEVLSGGAGDFEAMVLPVQAEDGETYEVAPHNVSPSA